MMCMRFKLIEEATSSRIMKKRYPTKAGTIIIPQKVNPAKRNMAKASRIVLKTKRLVENFRSLPRFLDDEKTMITWPTISFKTNGKTT